MQLDLSNLSTGDVLLTGAMGLAVMFFGYRIKKIAFFLIWFILGFHLTNLFLPQIAEVVADAFDFATYGQLLPIAGGLLLALLGFSIEKLCVGGICFALVLLVTTQYFGTDIQTLAIGAVVGVIAAGAAVMMMKPATILATSVAGSYTVVMALLVLIPGANHSMYLPTLIAFSVIAAVVQFLTTKNVD